MKIKNCNCIVNSFESDTEDRIWWNDNIINNNKKNNSNILWM